MLSTEVGGVVVGVVGPAHDVTKAHRIFSVQRMRLDGDINADGTVRPGDY
jgi:hypothetical protein